MYQNIYDILDGKHLRQLKKMNIQQRLPILHCENSVLEGWPVENGAKIKRLDRDVRKENGGCFRWSRYASCIFLTRKKEFG